MNINLSEILNKCLSANSSLRQEGEKNLEQMANTNYGNLLELCARELSDEDKTKETRQLSATIIKNMICNSEEHMHKWHELSSELKTKIKSYTLSCLASKIKEVRKASGLAVAGNNCFYLPFY
jgi:hypothetical protein